MATSNGAHPLLPQTSLTRAQMQPRSAFAAETAESHPHPWSSRIWASTITSRHIFSLTFTCVLAIPLIKLRC